MSLDHDPKASASAGYAEAKRNADRDPSTANLAILAFFVALMATLGMPLG